jgi:cysteine-rich repeat protein
MNKECELCGDGRKVGLEACDDGNIKDGDGCSHKCELETGWSCDSGSGCAKCGDGVISGSEECEVGTAGTSGCTDCKLDPGFTWVGGTGDLSCVPTHQWQQDVNDQLSRGVTQCARQEGPSYWEVAKPVSGEGACVETPNEIEGSARSMLETSIEPDAAAGATAAAQGGLILSPDFAEQLANPKLDTAFAVCKANRVQVCAMASVDTMAKPIRRCLSQARYDCVEVNVDATYCDSKEGKDLGAVKTSRAYESRTDSDGQVCVLKGCNVPSSWHLFGRSNSSQIEPAAWCFEVGANAGVLHYLV